MPNLDITGNILQVDGNISNLSEDENDINDTINETDDEVDSEPVPTIFFPIPDQNVSPGKPLKFDVKISEDEESSPLPLCLMLNCRSIYNKAQNLREILNTIGPSVTLLSETWERETFRLDAILKSRHFKSVSYFRSNRKPGGGCAILYDKNRLTRIYSEIFIPENIEATCLVLKPIHNKKDTLSNIKHILVGSIYVSPKSRFKSETIDHIIETIHTMRAKFNNEIKFLIGGDFNRLDVSDILESYGALRQVCSVPTRKQATLDILITDLHTYYHPPTTLPPLQVDSDKTGKDSDHDVVLFAPISNQQYKVTRRYKVIKTRPIPESQVYKFENELGHFEWDTLLAEKSPDEQAEHFHDFLRRKLDQYFPEKNVKICSLDKKWFTPKLKNLHRQMQRQFHKNRNSEKFKKIKAKFKKMKREAIKEFYSDFVTDLKATDPGKWYKMAKKIGALDQMTGGEINVESLENLSNLEAANKIAEHFAAISNEYLPIQFSQLPSYLPALPL